MEKLVKKKSLIITLITVMPLLIIGQLIINNSKKSIPINIFFLLIITLLTYGEYILFIKIYKMKLSNKENIIKSMQFFSNDSHVEVIPIKDEPNHEKFVTEHLSKKATFYATDMEDGTVMISLRFNGDNEEIYYGGLDLLSLSVYFKKAN